MRAVLQDSSGLWCSPWSQALVDDVLHHKLNRVTVEGPEGEGKVHGLTVGCHE
jgi:hypothetical protein